MRHNCYIIAGSNGAGKTTFAQEFLPAWIGCVNFINPDLIAKGLSPFAPEKAMIHAGRLVLEEIKKRSNAGEDFAFETTLSGRTYLRTLSDLRTLGYNLNMFYLWIPSPELALKRIEDRVASGGHSVPDTAVRRRFDRTWENLVERYRSLLDTLFVFDNSGRSPILVFEEVDGRSTISDKQRYEMMFQRNK